MGIVPGMCLFLSTPSARRATDASPTWEDITQFLSTPSARRATSFADGAHLLHGISIHALREEGDGLRSPDLRRGRHFYPRPPRGGRRRITEDNVPAKLFLSTPSARRATAGSVRGMAVNLFLSTPSARRATHPAPSGMPALPISIHALREEGDGSCFTAQI